MGFSTNLKKIIEERGLRLTAISESTGIPMSTLSEWTAGREPKISDSLIKLSQFLGLTLDELVCSEPKAALPDKVVALTSVQIEGVLYRIAFHRLK
jgi:transcriptional regulator with XRE-family HTH domain